MTNFKPGDRIVTIYDSRGTVTTATENELRVQFDGDDFDLPVPPNYLHLEPKKNDRDGLAKVTATANDSTTTKDKDEPLMNKPTDFAGHVSTPADPPAGFKMEYFCICGLGCTPDNVAEGCEIMGTLYDGPSATNSTDDHFTQIQSSWSEEEGINFFVWSHGWTTDGKDNHDATMPREHLEKLPAMITELLDRIDYLGAESHLNANPELIERAWGTSELASYAMEHGLKPAALFEAVGIKQGWMD